MLSRNRIVQPIGGASLPRPEIFASVAKEDKKDVVEDPKKEDKYQKEEDGDTSSLKEAIKEARERLQKQEERLARCLEDLRVSRSTGDLKWSVRSQDHPQWLLCDGRRLSVNDYPELFEVLQYTFGGEPESGEFALPDGRGRVLGGVGEGEGLSNRQPGERVGEELHTLTLSEMPMHRHDIGAPQWVRKAPSSIKGSVDVIGASGAGETSNIRGLTHPHNIMQPTLFAGSLFIFA
jgi:microcystin-dependent protein